ncbi:MAG: GNAT family N-acetyltransferase [candidate division WOR-3 bacterium]
MKTLELKVTKLSKEVRSSFIDILNRTPDFNEKDKKTCLYVFDGIERGEYEGIGIFENGNLLGFILFSENFLADSVMELLWIVVDPNFYGQGIAEILFQEFLNEVNRRKIRMIVLETQEKHKRARRFYEKMGFKKEAEIKDFYRVGESKEIWVKRL